MYLGGLRVLLADFFTGPTSATQRFGRHARPFLDGVVFFGVALPIMAVAIPHWLAWLFHDARTFKTRLRLGHPGALVVDTFWTGKNSAVLKKGPLISKGEGEGIHLGLVADACDLQLVRQRRRPVYFGFVPREQGGSFREILMPFTEEIASELYSGLQQPRDSRRKSSLRGVTGP
jgi:hypothetical protein